MFLKQNDRIERYVVAGSKIWHRDIFDKTISKFKGKWIFVTTEDELDRALEIVSPRYIFFLHWSWIVPDEIINRHECVCFHMTDVPYGRGGSPLQNLILRGHKETKLTALRMVKDLDAGPVYMKRPLSLFGSSAEEIYIRASSLSADMIKEIIEKRKRPKPQKGKATIFKRRTPLESEIPELNSLEALYDFIRMLDAEGYPMAFINYKGFSLKFSKATLYDGKLIVEAEIRKADKK